MIKNSNNAELKEGNSNDLYTLLPTVISLFGFDRHKNGWTLWYNRKNNGTKWYHSKSVSFGNHYGIWEKPNEMTFRDNGAKKNNPKDTCYDCTLTIGKLTFGYTNWSF